MNIKMRNAREDDVNAVVDVHVRAFPDFFMTNLGSRFIREYYRFYLDSKHHFLVATNDRDEILGFVVGSDRPCLLYADMKRQFTKFIIPLMMSSLNLRLGRKILVKVFRFFLHDTVNNEIKRLNGFSELTSIAVEPSCQGVSVGNKLLASYLENARGNPDLKGVFLTTDDKDNEKVINFYKSSGFNVYSTFSQSASRSMVALRYNFKKS